MATKTLYPLDTRVASGTINFHTMQEGGVAPTDAAYATATGWEADSKAIGQSALLSSLAEVARTSGDWSATLQPSVAPNVTRGDAWRAGPYTGVFAATAWTLAMAVRSATAAYAGRCRLRWRVYKSANADGSGATELTGATVLSGATTANLSTTVTTTLSASWSPGAITLNNEYLFFQLAIEVTAAGSANTQDVNLRKAPASAITTPDFAAITTKASAASAAMVLTPNVDAIVLAKRTAADAQMVLTPAIGALGVLKYSAAGMTGVLSTQALPQLTKLSQASMGSASVGVVASVVKNVISAAIAGSVSGAEANPILVKLSVAATDMLLAYGVAGLAPPEAKDSAASFVASTAGEAIPSLLKLSAAEIAALLSYTFQALEPPDVKDSQALFGAILSAEASPLLFKLSAAIASSALSAQLGERWRPQPGVGAVIGEAQAWDAVIGGDQAVVIASDADVVIGTDPGAVVEER